MTDTQLIGVVFFLLAGGTIAAFLYFYLFAPRQQANIRSLMGGGGAAGFGSPSEARQRLQEDETGQEFERLKQETKKSLKKKEKLTLDDRFFQAGLFSDEEKAEFHRKRIIIPVILAPLTIWFTYGLGADLALAAGVISVLCGIQAPSYFLDRQIKARHEDILFYLPLVIEQVSIGVSSSLDIGPCITRIISMADERDTHNVVTELLRNAQFYMKSGVSFEAALTEIGKRTGHTELKHAFMSLSQVSKHGGEISRQLQELADAVSAQRETKIEAKIKKLELEATGPVALVFMGFLVIVLIGFGIQIKKAF